MFQNLHVLCTRETRLVMGYFSLVWHPALKCAEATELKMPQPPQNVLSPGDVGALVALADFEVIKSERRVLLPLRLLGAGRLINRFVAPLPLIDYLCLRHFTVCRSLLRWPVEVRSATIVIPARNECGNIEPGVKRIPAFVALEIIFVEGHSRDGT